MKVRGVIFQIIKWEDRNKYFWATTWKNDGEYDLIHIGSNEDKNIPWWKKGLIGSFIQLPLQLKNRNLGGFSQDYVTISLEKGLPVWQKRPHNFTLNQIVEIEVNLSEIQNNTEVNH